MSTKGGWGARVWVTLIAAVLLSSALGFGGGFRYAEATLPTANGVWSGDWFREAYGWFASALHLDYATAGKLLYANAGKNVTSSTIDIGSGNDLTGVDTINATGDITTTGDVEATNGNFTSLYVNDDLLLQGENKTAAIYYPEIAATTLVEKIGSTYYAFNGTTKAVLSQGTDAATVIQSGLGLGGLTLLKTGNFTITRPLNVTSNSILSGSGWGTILFLATNTQINVIQGNDVSGVVVCNLKVDGNRANQVLAATDNVHNNVYFNNSTRCRVQNIQSVNAPYHGIFFVDTCTYNDIVYNQIQDCGFRGIHSHGNCDFNKYSYNVVVNTGLATSFGGLFVIYDGNDYNQVDHNTIVNASAQAIPIFGQDPAGLNLKCTYNRIESNTIYQHSVTRSAIVLRGTLEYTTIKDNTIYSGNHGIVTDASTTLTNSEIVGNTIYAAVKGIYWTAGSITQSIISDNNIQYTSTGGMYLNAITYSKICNNYIYVQDFNADQYDSIYLGGTCTYNQISGNYFRTQASYGGRYQINEVGASCDYNRITDNYWVTTAGSFAVIVGANTVLNNNGGYVTEKSGTATLLNGQNHVHVTHGLSYTPTAKDITITFTELPTNALTGWYVGNITSTEFLLFGNDPGASNLDFGWSAHKTP